MNQTFIKFTAGNHWKQTTTLYCYFVYMYIHWKRFHNKIMQVFETSEETQKQDDWGLWVTGDG